MGLYPDYAFHNAYHGFSVFQFVFVVVNNSIMKNVFRNVDVFGLLVAGLCHDVDHRGVNNAYLINVDDELAVRYNDTSVLENHHAAKTVALMKNQSTMIDTGLCREGALSLKRTIIRSILATDMAHHHDI